MLARQLSSLHSHFYSGYYFRYRMLPYFCQGYTLCPIMKKIAWGECSVNSLVVMLYLSLQASYAASAIGYLTGRCVVIC